MILAPKRPLQLSKFKYLNSKFESQASSCITNLNKHLRSMGAGEVSTHQKTSKNSAKQWFWRQNDRYSSQNSNIWIQISNFKPLLALRTFNITYMKHLRSMGAREASTDQKTSKNSEKQWFWRQNDRYNCRNSNFLIQNSNFKTLLALRTSNNTYMKHLRSIGAGEASTGQKTSKNSGKQWFWRQNDRYNSQNSDFWIQNFNFKPRIGLRTPNIT